MEIALPAPVDLNAVLLTSLLNPVVIVVAFWMGTGADQWQKLPLAAFAAAAAGTAAVYAAVRLGIPGIVKTARALAGVFTVQFLLAWVWAYLGYRVVRRAP
jgi:zinc transporter ZupT